jgi:hypothetical protein
MHHSASPPRSHRAAPVHVSHLLALGWCAEAGGELVAVASGTSNVAVWLVPSLDTRATDSHPPPEPQFLGSISTERSAASYSTHHAVTALVLASVPAESAPALEVAVRTADRAAGFCRHFAAATSAGSWCVWRIDWSRHEPLLSTVSHVPEAHAARIGAVTLFSRRDPASQREPVALACTAGDDEAVCLWLVEGQSDAQSNQVLRQLPRDLLLHDAWNGILRSATAYYVRPLRRVTMATAAMPLRLEPLVAGHVLLLFAGSQLRVLATEPEELLDEDGTGLEYPGPSSSEARPALAPHHTVVSAGDGLRLVGALGSDVTAVAPPLHIPPVDVSTAAGTMTQQRWYVAVGTESGHIAALIGTMLTETATATAASSAERQQQAPQQQQLTFAVTRPPKQSSTRHLGHVTSLEFSSQLVGICAGSPSHAEAAKEATLLLLSASFDCTVQVHRFPELVTILSVRAHTDAARCARFHLDLACFASCGTDGVLKVWRLDGQLVTSLRRIALSHAEHHRQQQRSDGRRAASPPLLRRFGQQQHQHGSTRPTRSSPSPSPQRRDGGLLPRRRSPSPSVITSPRSSLKRTDEATLPTHHLRTSMTGGYDPRAAASPSRFTAPPLYSKLLWCHDGESILTLQEGVGQLRRVGVHRTALGACPSWIECFQPADDDTRLQPQPQPQRRRSDEPREISRHSTQAPPATTQKSRPAPVLAPAQHPTRGRTQPPPAVITRNGYRVLHHVPPEPSPQLRDASPQPGASAPGSRSPSARASASRRSASPVPSLSAHGTFHTSVDGSEPSTLRHHHHHHLQRHSQVQHGGEGAWDAEDTVLSPVTPTNVAVAPKSPLSWLAKCALNLTLLTQVGLGPFDPAALRVVAVPAPSAAVELEAHSTPRRLRSPPARQAHPSTGRMALDDSQDDTTRVIDAHTRLNLMAAVDLVGVRGVSSSPGRQWDIPSDTLPTLPAASRATDSSVSPVRGGQAPSLRQLHAKRIEQAILAATVSRRVTATAAGAVAATETAEMETSQPTPYLPSSNGVDGVVSEQALRLESISTCFAPTFTHADLQEAAKAAAAQDTSSALLIALLPCMASAHHAWLINAASPAMAPTATASLYPPERTVLWAAAHRAIARLAERPPRATSSAADPAPHDCAFIAGRAPPIDAWAATTANSVVELHPLAGDPLAPLVSLTSLTAAKMRLPSSSAMAAVPSPVSTSALADGGGGGISSTHNAIDLVVTIIFGSAAQATQRRYIGPFDGVEAAHGVVGAALGCVGQGALAVFPAGQQFAFRGVGAPAISAFVRDATARSWLQRVVRGGGSVVVLEEMPSGELRGRSRSRSSSPGGANHLDEVGGGAEAAAWELCS